MLKFRSAPLAGAAVLMLLLTARAAFAQPVAVPGGPLGGSSVSAVATGDEASSVVMPRSAKWTTAGAGSAGYVLAGLDNPATDMEFSATLESMLTLYSQLLAIDGQAASSIGLQRLRARLAGGAETGLLALEDVLAADFSRVELLALPRERMSELGLDATYVSRLPLMSGLIDDLRSAMLDMPEGLATISGPVALAVWGREAGAPLVAILLLAAP